MKNFGEYILEKLKIDKNIEKQVEDPFATVKDIYLPPVQKADRDKMNAYRSKGSKPLTLVHTIKDREKLLRRFRVALEMGWDSAVREFANGIVNRGYYTRDEINKYIAKNKK